VTFIAVRREVDGIDAAGSGSPEGSKKRIRMTDDRTSGSGEVGKNVHQGSIGEQLEQKKNAHHVRIDAV